MLSLAPLPYEINALEPILSEQTIHLHYHKHHKGYLEKLNRLIVGTKFEDLPLEDIIINSTGSIFNNAAQVYNHDFYWNSIYPPACLPSGYLNKVINSQFGSIQGFNQAIVKIGMEAFGSAWIWVTLNDKGQLIIITTKNADNVLNSPLRALLCIDLWEHAYYVDYFNEKEQYLKNIVPILNWDFANHNLNKL